MSKLKITVTGILDIPEDQLETAYEASSVQEAAQNLTSWYKDGSADLFADLSVVDELKVTIEPVPEV